MIKLKKLIPEAQWGKMPDKMVTNMQKTLIQQVLREKKRIEDELAKSYPAHQLGIAYNSTALEQHLLKEYPTLVKAAINNYSRLVGEMSSGTGTFGRVFYGVLNNAPDPYGGLPQQDSSYEGSDKIEPIRNVLWPEMRRWFVEKVEHFKRLYKIDKAIDAYTDKHNISESVKQKLGKCYELSGRYVCGHPEAILVHGYLVNKFTIGLRKINHAWVEEGDEVFDPVMGKRFPKAVYDGIFQPIPKKRYSFDDVIRLTNKSGNWGPWKSVKEHSS